jgi:regulator of replication initiation timing
VVEYYRADILSARQLAEELQISPTLLRCWNRWYFKIRLLRHFKSKLSFAMKNKDQEIEKLKAELAQAYKENAQLKLKNEALQVMIHLAEDKFNMPIEKSPYQTVQEMNKRHPLVGMQRLCDLFIDRE